MHDDAAREIHHAHGLQEAAAPDPVRARNVNQKEPADHEQDEGREAHAVGDRARDQRAGNHREGHLIGRKQRFRKIRRKRVHRVEGHSRHEKLVEVADIRAVAGEGQRVSGHEPQQRYEHHARETLRHGGEQVLLADQARVKQRETRYRHHQHERGRCDHPRGVGCVDRACLSERRRCRAGRASGCKKSPKAFHQSPLEFIVAPTFCV